MLIIGISGVAASGKTEAATMIGEMLYQKTRGAECLHEESFADPLKEAMGIIFGLSPHQLHGAEMDATDRVWKVTPRHILQVVGTDVFRDQIGEILPTLDTSGNNGIWIRNMQRRLKDVRALESKSGSQHIVIINDVRFEDELNMLFSLGQTPNTRCILLRIERSALRLRQFQNHISERGLEHVDAQFGTIVVRNNGTLEDLRERLVEVLADIE